MHILPFHNCMPSPPWSQYVLGHRNNACSLLSLGNPLEEKHSGEGDWRDQVIKRLPKLKKLDGTYSTHKKTWSFIIL